MGSKNRNRANTNNAKVSTQDSVINNDANIATDVNVQEHKLSEKRLAAIAARKVTGTQRSSVAKMLLMDREKKNKQRSSKKTGTGTYTAKTARYNSIYTGVKCMHTLAAMLLINGATQQEQAAAFIQAYAIKQVTDLKFIAGRMQIYLTHSKTTAILEKLKKQKAEEAKKQEPAKN